MKFINVFMRINIVNNAVLTQSNTECIISKNNNNNNNNKTLFILGHM